MRRTDPPPSPRRSSRRRRGFALAVLILAAAFALDLNAPAIVVVAALIPATAFTALIAWFERRSPLPWLPMLAALLWGGTVAALGALLVNDFAGRILANGMVATLIAPLVEEACKASALVVLLLVWNDAWRDVREGMIYGALVGVGFAATENLGYYVLAAVQDGPPGLARALYLRGVLEGLNHAAFTAMIGAGAGYARGAYCAFRGARLWVTLSAFLLAVATHALWNLSVSPRITAILCNASQAGGACATAPDAADLLLHVPALIVVFLGPVAALLFVFARQAERGAAQEGWRR